MMMRAIALMLCLALPLGAYAQSGTGQPSGPIAIEDSAAQDGAIATRIREILSELEGYEDVTVTVSAGIVALRGTTLDAPSAARLAELVGRVQGVVAIKNHVAETTDVAERLTPAMDRFKARAAQALAFLPLLMIALAVFGVVVALGWLIARMRRPWDRLAPNAFIADIYRQVIRLAFVVGGLVLALDILGATALLGTILGAAGIIGLAIGFAVKDTVENFIASIMLSIRQPFRPNDTVEIEGDRGKVIRLTSRATILLSFDGNHIRIPNATVFKSRIVNFSRNAERRFTLSLSVRSDADLAQARQVAQDVLSALPFVLESPAASVWIDSVGDSWVALEMAAWINQNETDIVLARSEAIRLTQGAFDAAGLSAPEPTYRLLHEGGAAAPAPPAPAAPAAQAPELAEAEPVGAKADKELENIVDIERATEHPDLLRQNGQQE
ncbi:MAG: mechanosensitive ion channel domain-containing protein [Sulfitobacter sp.]